MARIGISPTRKAVTRYRPHRVTAVVVVYIPSLEGYYAQRLDILKLTLHSLRQNTSQPLDVLVFDNGSCAPVLDFLHTAKESGLVDYLMLSRRNIGKIGAFQMAFPAAPGEIIASADDDIFFYPGWLEASLQILETFPNTGMVSAVPVRHASDRARLSLEKWIARAPEGLRVARKRHIPDEWEADWARSTGRDPQAHLEATRHQTDLILQYRGVEAVGTASHFQFIAPKDAIVKALPQAWTGRLMGQMNEMEARLDSLGYLRLATPKRYVRHMGNVLNEDFRKEAAALGVSLQGQSEYRPRQRPHWLLRIPGSGRVLWPLYRYLFRVLHNVE